LFGILGEHKRDDKRAAVSGATAARAGEPLVSIVTDDPAVNKADSLPASPPPWSAANERPR